jgi:uncharacterized membrane protein
VQRAADGEDEGNDEGYMFSDETKTKCGWFVYCIAVCAFIIGLVLCIYGALSFSGGEVAAGEYKTELNVDANKAIGYLCMVGGILALLVAILGCLAVYCKNCCTALTYCIVAFVVGLICLIAGAVVLGLDWDQIKTEACITERPEFNDKSGEIYMRQQYGSMVDDVLCSANCVCDESVALNNGDDIKALSNLADYGTSGRGDGAG